MGGCAGRVKDEVLKFCCKLAMFNKSMGLIVGSNWEIISMAFRGIGGL